MLGGWSRSSRPVAAGPVPRADANRPVARHFVDRVPPGHDDDVVAGLTFGW